MAIVDSIKRLLGFSAFEDAPKGIVSLGAETVNRIRRAMGGQLQPVARTESRWLIADVEQAEREADMGQLARAARIARSVYADPIFIGVGSTRFDGLTQLPKTFAGRADIVDALTAVNDLERSVFDEMCPSTELSLLNRDGRMIGVGVGELLPVAGRRHPLLVRLDPEFLVYRHHENRWYFRSIAGLLPITPGDGRWVLHMPGGRLNPWQNALWRPTGRAVVRKEGATSLRDEWEHKLANAARVAKTPAGATDKERTEYLEQVASWGADTVIMLPPGYELSLLEGKGEGAQSFRETIQEQSDAIKIAVTGNTVLADGASGFVNTDIFKSIRSDLVQGDGDGLAHTVNTQILPPWVADEFGEEALDEGVRVGWNTKPPKDRNGEATVVVTVANAVKGIVEAVKAAKDAGLLEEVEVDVKALLESHAIPLRSRSTDRGHLRVVRGAA